MTYEKRKKMLKKLREYGYNYENLAKLLGHTSRASFNSSSARDRYIKAIHEVILKVEGGKDTEKVQEAIL